MVLGGGKEKTQNNCRKRQKVIQEVVDGPMDYTLMLPESLLHHILSYLTPKDAARCCLLSKRWKQVRNCSPTLDFDQNCFKGLSDDLFHNFVHQFLQRINHHKYGIQKFKLTVTSSSSNLASHIDTWLDVAVNNNVKEMKLQFPLIKHPRPYRIPSFVFTIRTLTSLNLDFYRKESNCCTMLELPDGINLPNLTKLRLKTIRLTEKTLQKLISSCTSIECLILVSCKGLVNLEVSTLERLNRVEVHFCKGIRKVEILAPKLESFWYYGYKYGRCALNLSLCPSLKTLTLEDPSMDDFTFQSLILNFPYLEHLVLSTCNAMKNINISLAKLKSLVLRGCKNLIGGHFLVPQLMSFEYSGCCNLLFSFLNPSSLRKAKLQFKSMQENIDFINQVMFFMKLKNFFSSFDQSTGFKLVMHHKGKIAVYQQFKDFNLPWLPHMKFEVIKPSMKLEELFEYLLQAYLPVTLSLVADEKIILEKIINQVIQKGNLNCCTYRKQKCWRHNLIGIEHCTLPVYGDELNTWMASIEAEELPSTTINMTWEKRCCNGLCQSGLKGCKRVE